VVVGLGAIGGSLALALRRSGVRVRGHSLDPDDRRAASAAGIEVSAGAESPRDLVAGASALLIAVPIEAVAGVASAMVPFLSNGAPALHVASLQRRQAVRVPDALWPRLFGTHPMAGTHGAGFAAADAELFDRAVVFVEERADEATRRAADALWSQAGAARVEYRSAEEHDAEMAWVSHLPQLAATAVAGVLSARGTSAESVGPGGRDTTRLAASPFDLWAEILERAPDDTVAALDALERRVAAIRAAVAGRDRAGLAREWGAAREWRRAVAGQVA
jgi:3-phosphoshikimate 1-carboxyvinyltransferase